MSKAGLQARLESGLLKIWYGAARPAPHIRLLLNLLEGVYKGLRTVTRQQARTIQARRTTTPPVLVVGNLIAGGAGKTPVVLAVCQTMALKHRTVGIVSRGYGRRSQEAFLINPTLPLPAALEVGDEPLFLAKQTGCLVAVSADRNQAVQLLRKACPGLDLIVSDDGLQHHRLARQIEWVVFDERAQGNGRLLPAGPLREPVNRLLSVDAVLCSNISTERLANQLGLQAGPHWHEIQVRLSHFRQVQTGKILDLQEASRQWAHGSVLAFTGIANPEKLFGALRQAGIPLQSTLSLPDHFRYPEDYCNQFSQQVLITTGKDAVKLNDSNPAVWVAEICIGLPPALTLSLEESIGPTVD